MLIYQTADPAIGNVWFGLPYLSISLSLNVLLTIMIVVRLVLLSRNIRATMGPQAGIAGLCKSIATMLVESSALFAVSSLLVIGTWPTPSPVGNVFPRILAETQVRAFTPTPSFGQVIQFDDEMYRSLLHYSSFNGSPTRVR